MRSSPAVDEILTLSEQLDAMLLGWLERRAGDQPRPQRTAKGVVIAADEHVEQIEAFCARWDMTVQRLKGTDSTVLIIEGRELPVRGFTEITAMYRS